VAEGRDNRKGKREYGGMGIDTDVEQKGCQNLADLEAKVQVSI
jgi:hypothetical protein